MAKIEDQFNKLGIVPKKCKTNISYELLGSSDKVEGNRVDILHLVDDTNDPPLNGESTPSGLTPSSAAQPTASRVARGQKESLPGFRSPQITYLSLTRRRRVNTDRVWINVSLRTDQMLGTGFKRLLFKLTPRRDEFAKNIEYDSWPHYATCYNSTRGKTRTILIGKGLETRAWGRGRQKDIIVPETAMSMDLDANLVTLWIGGQCFADIELQPYEHKYYTHKAYVELDVAVLGRTSVWDLETR